MNRLATYLMNRPQMLTAGLILALVGLPVALWFDLKDVSDQSMRRQVTSLNQVIDTIRDYYSVNVVDRILETEDTTPVLHNYQDFEGAIPIPATMSIELGEELSALERGVNVRFISDFPFVTRDSRPLDRFEQSALEQFRSGAVAVDEKIYVNSGNLWDRRVTVASPILMGHACVACHNSHTESTKTDWKEGDVRGLQTVTMHQPIALNIWAFQWLLLYFAFAGTLGLIYCIAQFRMARGFRDMNDELTANNEFLASISLKISKYLSPQVYRSIFSGEKDASLTTERKKLTVFFSDIKDFTSTSEQLQPEELTNLLNEYFTEMSGIAERHGATIDKFIGDAIVAFFGDPTTKGTQEDARACVRMAIDMQRRLAVLEREWQARGIEHPFRARIGINTGYCNVGNFGSEDRMDYTIIGAEANLAARLEGIADPGGIVMSYETQAHVSDLVRTTKMEATRFKGIARDVVPYKVDMSFLKDDAAVLTPVEVDSRLTIDLEHLDEELRAKVRAAVHEAISAVSRPKKQ